MREFNQMWLKNCPELEELPAIARRLHKPILFISSIKANPGEPEIVEYAHCYVRQDGFTTTLHSLIDPEKPIVEYEGKEHRIADHQVGGSPAFGTLVEQLAQEINDGCLLVGWQIKNDLLPTFKALAGEDHPVYKALESMDRIDFHDVARSKMNVSTARFREYFLHCRIPLGMDHGRAYRRVVLMLKRLRGMGKFEFGGLTASIVKAAKQSNAPTRVVALVDADPLLSPEAYLMNLINTGRIKGDSDLPIQDQIRSILSSHSFHGVSVDLDELTYELNMTIGALIKTEMAARQMLRAPVCDKIKPALEPYKHAPTLRLKECRAKLDELGIRCDYIQIRIALSELGHPQYA